MNEQPEQQGRGAQPPVQSSSHPGVPATFAPPAVTQEIPVAPAGRPAPSGPSIRRIVTINAIILAVILVIAGIAYYVWHQGYYYYSTDDAKVDGNIVTLATLQPGTIQTVN